MENSDDGDRQHGSSGLAVTSRQTGALAALNPKPSMTTGVFYEETKHYVNRRRLSIRTFFASSAGPTAADRQGRESLPY